MRRKIWTILFSGGCFLLALSPGGHAMAQERKTVKGVVTDAGKSPLAGVTVQVKGSTNAAVTDNDGHYSVTALQSDSISFSMIGFGRQMLAVGAGDVLNIVLSQDARQLDGVVVTALGIKRQTRSLGYATQQIGGDEINAVKNPGANVIGSLSGKVAGAVVTPVATGPGGAARIVLRGNRSISGNNNALIVVDGVPIDNTMTTEQGGSGSANTVATQQKSLSSGYSGSDGAASINPDDIENITVLKGPAAAALYGNRAANGALIITTKSGSRGKLSVSYNGAVSMDKAMLLMDLQNTYGRGNGGVAGAQAAQSYGAATTTYPDNLRDFYRTGVSTDHSVSVSGGTEKMRGYASYTYNNNQGIVPKNGLGRNTLNLRLNSEIIPKLTTDVKLTYISQDIHNKPRLGDNGVTNEALIMPRDMPGDSLMHFENYNTQTGQPVPFYWTNSSIFQNPYWDVYRTNLSEHRNRVMMVGLAKYQLADWLSVQGRYSLDRYDDKITAGFYAGTLPITTNAGGRYQEAYVNHWERNMDLLISGTNKISQDIGISYNIGAAVLRSKGYNSQAFANGLSIPNQFNLNFATTPSVSSIIADKEIQSVYANTQLSFKKWLYADVSARNDWSSTLPSPHSYFYPSAGLSFVLSDIITMPRWISFGKIRGSFTQVGNDADPYLLVQTYSYAPGAGSGFVSRDVTQYINNLKPEKTRSWEVGVEWKFLEGKLSLDATAYSSNTFNQLIFLGLPQASGYNQQYINAGNISNKGIEAMLTATALESKNFKWSTGINFALNRNKVISLSGSVKQASLSTATGLGSLLIRPGGAYGDIYDYDWAREEKSGRYLVNTNGLPVLTSLQKIGNFNPDYTLGWNNRFEYKKLSLSVLLDGRVGGTLVSGTDAMMAYFGISEYTTRFREGGLVLNGITADGSENSKAVSAEQLWSSVSQGGRSGYAGFFAYSTTNFRLRELSLTYQFDFTNKRIRSLRVALTGRNLFFLYRGKSLLDLPGIGKRTIPVDPEVAIGAGNYQGIESGLLPGVRSFGLNASVSF